MSSVKIENFTLKFPEALDQKQTLPSDLTNKAFAFYLTEVKSDDGVLVEFDKPKQMVPTFDQTKADSVLILQYSNAEEGVAATVSVKLKLDLSTGEFDISGYGFTELSISAEVESFPTLAEHEASLTKDVEANKIEDAYDASGEDLGK